MIAEWLVTTRLPDLAGHLLRSVPGLPPVLQTIHLLGVAMLMGSVLVLAARVLGLVARRQDLYEMSARLLPWFLSALPIMVLSGLPFFVARPQRYVNNPVFTIKLYTLVVTLLLSGLLWRRLRQQAAKGYRHCQTNGQVSSLDVAPLLKCLALVVMAGWVITTLAGRWIAYADYLFWPG